MNTNNSILPSTLLRVLAITTTASSREIIELAHVDVLVDATGCRIGLPQSTRFRPKWDSLPERDSLGGLTADDFPDDLPVSTEREVTDALATLEHADILVGHDAADLRQDLRLGMTGPLPWISTYKCALQCDCRELRGWALETLVSWRRLDRGVLPPLPPGNAPRGALLTALLLSDMLATTLPLTAMLRLTLVLTPPLREVPAWTDVTGWRRMPADDLRWLNRSAEDGKVRARAGLELDARDPLSDETYVWPIYASPTPYGSPPAPTRLRTTPFRAWRPATPVVTGTD